MVLCVYSREGPDFFVVFFFFLNNNVEVYLFADGRGIHPRRLVLALLQRELVLCGFPVDGVIEVHAGHVAVQIVPVQQESPLEKMKRHRDLNEEILE